MAYDETLAERIREGLARRQGIEEKKMFGGIGFLLNGNMCVGVWKNSLIARIDLRDGAAALEEPGVREFDVTGRPMKGWILVDPEGTEDDDQLHAWIKLALKFVAKMPGKE
jgi:TfoX/Sxy family transcriptional regulator of competence genes